MTRVFVYGSLLRGLGNHRLLERARFVGVARTPARFTMHDLGAFPAIANDGHTAIVGEVYAVDGPTLERLDRLEGHPTHYRREPIELEDGELAHIYVYVASLAGAQVVASGDWRGHREKTR